MSKFCISSHRGGVSSHMNVTSETWKLQKAVKTFRNRQQWQMRCLFAHIRTISLEKDDVGRRKFNSRKEGVRGCRGKWRMKREEDLIKTRHIPFVGGESLRLPSAQRAWAETFEQRSPERKSSPSCPASHGGSCPRRRLSPRLPTCPRRAERTSCSGAPEQPIHHGSLTGSRSGRLLCYTAESQRENLRGVCLAESTQRGFWV